MKLGENRGSLIRVSIYVLALMVVLILLLHRKALIPGHGLWVNQIREIDRLGSLVAAADEKLVLVEVRLAAPCQILDHLGPSQFLLVDSVGGEHQPDALSPLFAAQRPEIQDQVLEGTLVFRLPRDAEGKSLYFQPEVGEHVRDSE